MEHKIGTHIALKVVETESITLCCGCFFRDKCTKNRSNGCNGKSRTDGIGIVYKKIKEE